MAQRNAYNTRYGGGGGGGGQPQFQYQYQPHADPYSENQHGNSHHPTSSGDYYNYPPPPSSPTASTDYGTGDSYVLENRSTDHFATRSTDHFARPDSIIEQDRTGADSYPPNLNGRKLWKEGKVVGFTGAGDLPMSRASIAAQMAAEGQIPKKEGFRMWRKEQHRGAMMKGGRVRCCGRFCGATIILGILSIIVIVSMVGLLARPPYIHLNGIDPPSNGQQVDQLTDGFQINVVLNIEVINPNILGITFANFSAIAHYPTNPKADVGGGSISNLVIKRNSNTTIHFPFQVNYTTLIDSGLTMLQDIATKCGIIGGGPKGDLTIGYTVKFTIKVLSLSISPSFMSSTTILCPLDTSDLSGLLENNGLAALEAGSKGAIAGLIQGAKTNGFTGALEGAASGLLSEGASGLLSGNSTRLMGRAMEYEPTSWKPSLELPEGS